MMTIYCLQMRIKNMQRGYDENFCVLASWMRGVSGPDWGEGRDKVTLRRQTVETETEPSSKVDRV